MTVMLIAAASASGVARAQSARSGAYRVTVTATPRHVPADGQTAARLRIDVRSQNGSAAPDGTQVVVRTDLGQLSLGTIGQQTSLTVATSGGFVAVYATSLAPGTATITTQVADTRTVYYVDFIPEGERVQPDQRVLDISGNWVGYSPALNVIEARDQAQVRLGRVVLEAGGLVQIDVGALTLKAQKVAIRRGEKSLVGEDLYYDLATKRGVLRRFGDGKVERVFFDVLGLEPADREWEIPEDAFRVDRRESDMWLLARTISFFLREKIVLRKGSIWSQGQKVFNFPPYWIVGLPGYTGVSNSQALGVSSGGGVALDFPFFYRVTNTATGSVKIQNGASSSTFTTRSGWSIGLEEEYRSLSGTEGSLELAGLPHDDWGVSWTDSRTLFGTGLASTNVSMPDHRSLFADWNLYDYRGQGRLSVRAYYNSPVGFETTYGLAGDWLGDPRPIGSHNLHYRFGASVGGLQYADVSSPVLAWEGYAELSLGSRTIGDRTRFYPTVSNTYSWDSGGFSRYSARGDLRLTHEFTRSCSASLDYGTEWRSGDVVGGSRLQTLGLDLRAYHGGKWFAYANGTLDITNDDLYSFASLDYYVNRDWRCGLRSTYYDFDETLYKDLELSLGRAFGSREISLQYSTNTGDIWISLGGFGFQ